MNHLLVHIDGIGLLGPGFNGWEQSRLLLSADVLNGDTPFAIAPVQLPIAEGLPPAERRRVGLAVKLSMAIGFEAVRNAGADPAKLASVFSSTGGDCDNCHHLLTTLASNDRAVSPTRFHNSVHNAPAGYWSIATACMAASTSLCAYDATFAAALLETAAQVQSSGQSCLLVAFDSAYPEPLYSLRPIPYPFGIAMVLSPQATQSTKASLTIALTEAETLPIDDLELEKLRATIPTARALPLLQQLARAQSGSVVIEYLNTPNLIIEVTT
jgi:hypothetical protein